MSDSNNNNSGGINFAGLLAIVFIVLKLTGVINWSWWWVLSPLWLGLGVFFIALGFIFGYALISAIWNK